MATVCATWKHGAWHVRCARGGMAEPHALERAAAVGRAEAWRLANAVRRDSAAWDLEYLKAALGAPETALGLAHDIADACDDVKRAKPREDAEVCRPAADPALDERAVRRALAMRGEPIRGSSWRSVADHGRFIVAAVAGLVALAGYVGRVSRQARELPQARNGGAGDHAMALHGEWSNRTRHLLLAAREGPQPAFVVLLGRLKESPARIAQRWADVGLHVPAVIVPVSVSAMLRALPQIATLLVQGLRHAPQRGYLPRMQEHAGIVFRVCLGSIAARWWAVRGRPVRSVLFGHTGTADVVLLEHAMQCAGARTTHVVHGLATGPNFAAFSDVGLFRCGADARRYAALGQYGCCDIQQTPRPAPRRGASGVFLMSNLAHPMNPRFATHGIEDELMLLRGVAAAAASLGPRAQPLHWKPHPVIDNLPARLASQLREQARQLGFVEVARTANLAETAARVRWNVCSPSTVAVDLLAAGILCIVLDPQRTLLDTSISRFPSAATLGQELLDLLTRLDDDAMHDEAFASTWDEVAPAAPLDLRRLAGGTG